MSGELYEVLGEGRFLPAEICPQSLRGRRVKVRPCDGEPIELDAEVACVAARVRASILQTGAEAEVAVPVKLSTLTKVVEYMKYHSDVPPGDLRTPLVSDNLSECGASKWDVTFVSVDKNLLVELLYASNAMDIPTLNLLAKAKATTMMYGKTPEQIRKDFNFSNDLPKSEEADITKMVRDLRKKRNVAFEEETGIAPTAAIIGSVWRLAEAHGAAEQAGGAPLDARSWRQGSWRAAVVEDWHQLEAAPPEVRGDRELLLASLTASRGMALRHASDALRSDRDVVLAAAACGGESFAEASVMLRTDRDFVQEVLAVNGEALAGAADTLRGDRALVLAAADARQGSALKGASDALRADADFVLEAAAKDPEALLHASDALRYDRAFAIRAAGSVLGALRRLPARLRADRQVVDAAVALDPAALFFAHAARRGELLDAPAAVRPGELAEEEYTGPRHLGVPLSEGIRHSTLKLTKSIVFTAMSTMTGNMGQSNYVAANSYLDKLAPYERPEIDAVGLMWGTVGGMGMRWKAFASADFMNQTPDLLMGIDDAARVLQIVACRMETPEWFAANYLDENVRNYYIEQSSKVGGYRLSEEQAAYPSIPERPAAKEGRPPARPRADAEPEEGWGGGSRSAAVTGARAGANSVAPLGGWPALATPSAAGQAAPAPVQRQQPARAAEAACGQLLLVEGAAVALTGLKNKSGATGVIVKCYPEGRYKVALDDKKGSALLKPEYLQVIAPPPLASVRCC